MTFKIDDTTESLITNLATASGFKVGDGEMPTPLPATSEAYAIVYTVPGGLTEGGMAGSLEMATVLYQVRVVGHTNSQCRKLQQLFHTILEAMWFDIVGCLGPARMALGGIVKEDERTFVANDTIYLQITQ